METWKERRKAAAATRNLSTKSALEKEKQEWENKCIYFYRKPN